MKRHTVILGGIAALLVALVGGYVLGRLAPRRAVGPAAATGGEAAAV